MGMSTLTRLLGVFVMTVAGLVLMGGPAVAQPGYGEGGPTVSLSATVSSTSITADGAGFEPGEAVTGTVFSDPWVLGTKNADSSGRVSFTFSVRDLEPGEHRLVLSADSGSVTARFRVIGRGGSDNVAEVSNNSSDDSDSDDSSSGGSSNDSSSDDSSSGDSSSGDSSSGDSSDSSDSSSSNPSSDGSSAGDSSNFGDLAFTGSNAIVPLSIIGGLLLVGGGVAVATSRRKRDKTRV